LFSRRIFIGSHSPPPPPGRLYGPSVGEIPADLGQLKKLSGLNLAANRLTGSIPASLGNLTMVVAQLDLAHNQLDGTVPSTFGRLGVLGFLNVEGNNLGGELDFLDTLSSCRALRNLYISMNSFTGRPGPEIFVARGEIKIRGPLLLSSKYIPMCYG